MIPFTYLEPAGMDEALQVLARYGDEARPIAGGTGLVNLMKQQLVQPSYLVGLRRLTELKGIGYEAGLTIGALTTLRTLESSPLVMQHAPLLGEAARRVATIRIRCVATIGGAVAHADPNEDLPPALIAMDARVRLRSRQRLREIALAEFFTGYYETVSEPNELVTEIIIPPQPSNSGFAFVKFLPQSQDDYATVAVAARVTLEGDRIGAVRVALGAVGATALVATNVADSLRGQVSTPAILRDAAEQVTDIVDPLSDFRGSASYKRAMASVFTRRALTQALVMAQAGGTTG
jgi:carbon-monoxide dehydrogenase medium subunit